MRYEEAGSRNRRRVWVPVAVAGAAVVAVVAVGVALSGDTGGPTPTTSPTTPHPGAGEAGASGADPTAVVTSRPSADPIATAQNWLTAYRTVGYRDPSPTSWAQRVAPLLAEPARSQIAQQAATATGGASWERFTAGRCDTHVSGLGAVIPPEAPRTTATVYVQVTATVVTSCAAGAAVQPDEPFSATLELHHDPDRDRWQVARRLY